MNNSLDRYSDFGVLLLRLSTGIIFMLVHGLGKFTGGSDMWKRLGSAMSNFGINFWHEFWGFMAMFSEFIVPVFLILGFWYRPALFLVTVTMIVAASTHLLKLDPWGKIAYPMMMIFVFSSMFIIGPGKYSIEHYLKQRKKVNEV